MFIPACARTHALRSRVQYARYNIMVYAAYARRLSHVNAYIKRIYRCQSLMLYVEDHG